MTKETAAQYLPLVQALAEGKVIQYRSEFGGRWFIDPNPSFTLKPEQYRVRPEPFECWANVYSDGKIFTHDSREMAECQIPHGSSRGVSRRTIRMIEAPEQ